MRVVRGRIVLIAFAVASAFSALGIGAACSDFAADTADTADTADQATGDAAAADAPVDADAGLSPADAKVEARVDAGPDAQFKVLCGPANSCGRGDSGAFQSCCYSRSAGLENLFVCNDQDKACGFTTTETKRYACDDTADCVAQGLATNICCATLGMFSGESRYYLFDARCTAAANCKGPLKLRRCSDQVDNECGVLQPCTDVTTFREPNDGSAWTVEPIFAACPFTP